jgi:hypothetical protein
LKNDLKKRYRYFLFLKNLEHGSIRLSLGNQNHNKIKNIDSNLEKTLKATGFLLLYNLIESTMRNAIETIFDDFQNKNVSFDEVRDEIKTIIIQNFKNKSNDNLIQVINNISVDIIFAGFDKKKTFSGNIDARKIRETGKTYGFSCQTNNIKTRDGNDLLNVKTNRNDLAHGFKSFEEVGREASAEELLKIKKRVIAYLRQILENIEDYIDKQEYLKSSISKL